MNFKRNLINVAVLSSTILLTACGGSGDEEQNVAPTAVNLSNASVDENAAGAVIGTLSATDSNAGDTFTFSTNDERFEVSGTSLKLRDEVALNFEDETSVNVSVTVTDSGNLSHTESLAISVNDLLDTYAFNHSSGESSVSYSGQIARHYLIAALNDYIGSLTTDMSAEELESREAVMTKLNSFYRMTAEEYDLLAETIIVDLVDSPYQTSLLDISSSLKDLADKIAGNDPVGQHKDWTAEGLVGWGEAGSTTPEGLLQNWFGMLADNAQTHIDGTVRQDINGNDINKLYITEDGRDLKQLIQKFLLGAVPFSQGTDDYLDDDTEGKGLLTSNMVEEGKFYSTLEHQWDEGFGYFGAARNYLDYSDDEIAGKGGREGWSAGYQDTDGDNLIDFNSEYNWGNSVNAAKRDRGTADATNPTDYSTQAFTAFMQGRNIINQNVGAELTDAQMQELQAQRDIAVEYWEKSIAATVVHYINDSNADLTALATDDVDFSYSDLAKHWSELKGFALGLQFNPRSPLTDEQFAELHSLIGDAPVLGTAEQIEAYQADLLAARDILQAAYEFDADHVANW